MYGLNDFNNNNNNVGNSFLNPNGLPFNYLGYIEYATNSNQDYLNTSQNEKTWLNNSLSDKNFLNSSLNLPIEQRYNSLNEMVAKITEEEKNLLANSTNNLNLLNQQQKLRHDSKKRDEFLYQNNQIRNNFNEKDYFKNNHQMNSVKPQATLNQNKSQLEYMVRQQAINSNMVLMNPYNPILNEARFQQAPRQDEINTQILNRPTNFTNVPSINNIFTANQLNSIPQQFNDNRLQKLVYPPSVSHQLATLSPDQQNFLLQQQNELVAALAASEQFAQYHHHPNRTFINNILPNPQINTTNQTSFASKHSSFVPYEHATQYAHQLNPNSNIIPNQFGLLNETAQQVNTNFEQSNVPFHPPFNYDINQQKLNMNDSKLTQLNQLNEKLKYLAIKQPYRQHRRTVPANELHVNIEECLYQLKCLEVERKKIETELSYLNMNKQTSKPLLNPPIVQLPRLSTNPSRVDRLIIDSLKEHTKTCLLISRIDHLNGTLFFSNMQSVLNRWLNSIQNVQARRNDEIINNSNRQRLTLNQPAVRVQDEKDVSLLANAVSLLAKTNKKARTVLWCAWQIGFFHQQPGLLTDDSNLNENVLNDQIKFEEFSKKIFQIKTDINETLL